MTKHVFGKTAVMAIALLLVSAVGFGTAFGYGGSGASSGREGARRNVGGGSVSSSGRVLGAETFVFTMDLSYGMSNNDVLELQKRLAAEGLFTVAPTGYFGPITLASVKAYQTAKGIPFITGFVGPLTRAELNKTQ